MWAYVGVLAASVLLSASPVPAPAAATGNVTSPAPAPVVQGESAADQQTDPGATTNSSSQDSNLAYELQQAVVREGSEIANAMEQVQQENAENFQLELGQATQNLGVLKQEMDKEIDDVSASQRRSITQLKQEVSDSATTRDAKFKQLESFQGNLLQLEHKMSGELESAQNQIQDDVELLKKKASHLEVGFSGEVTEVSHKAKEAEQSVRLALNSEIESAKATIHAEIEEVVSGMEDMETEGKNLIDKVGQQLTEARITTANEVNAAVQQDESKQGEVESALARAGAKIDEIQDASKSEVAGIHQQLTDETGRLGAELQTLSGKFQESKASMLSSLSEQIGAFVGEAKAELKGLVATYNLDTKERVKKLEESVRTASTQTADAKVLLDSTQNALGDQITVLYSQVGAAKANLDTVQSNLVATERANAEHILRTKNESEAAVAEMSSYTQNLLHVMLEEVKSQTLAARRSTLANLTDIKGQLLHKISDLRGRAGSLMENANATIVGMASMADHIAQGMDKVVGQVHAERAEAGQIKGVEQALHGALASVHADAKRVGQELRQSREAALSRLGRAEHEAEQASRAELTATGAAAKAELDGSSARVDGVLSQLRMGISALQNETSAAYAKRQAEQDQVRKELYAGLATSEARARGAEERGLQLQARVTAAASALEVAESDAARDSEASARHAQEVAEARLQAAAAGTTEQLRKEIASSDQQLQQFEQSAESDVAADDAKVQQYETATTRQVAALQSRVAAARQQLAQRQRATAAADTAFVRQLESAKQEQSAVKARADAEERAETAAVENRERELKRMLDGKVQGVERAEKAQVKELARAQQAQLLQERTRSALEQDTVLSRVETWRTRLDGEMAGVNREVSTAQQELRGYEKGAADDAARFDQEVAGLKQHIREGEATARAEAQREDEAEHAKMDQEMRGMRGLLASVAQAQHASDASITQARSSFAQRLAVSEAEAKQQAHEVALHLSELEANAAQMSSEYAADASATRAQLDHTQARLARVREVTNERLAGLRQQVEALKTTREADARAIQAKSASIEQAVRAETAKLSHTVDTMRGASRDKVQWLAGQQRQYDAKLESMAELAANHDGALAQTLGEKVYQLQQNNQRLEQWQSNFEQKQSSWRSEVEQRLQEIGTGGNLRSSFLESGEESTLRALNSELARENAWLSSEEAQLEQRVQRLEAIAVRKRTGH